jgi:hypothetical protein
MHSTAGIAQLVYLLDEAFGGPDWHSLRSNLQTLRPADWGWVPPGGQRSIKDIVQHVGSCKLMYHNHAFGNARLTWDHPAVVAAGAVVSCDTAIAWLTDAHQQLRTSITALDDGDLLHLRMTNWGELKETRWIIAALIQHDLYHAGEINHLRSLRHEHDQWAYAAD